MAVEKMAGKKRKNKRNSGKLNHSEIVLPTANISNQNSEVGKIDLNLDISKQTKSNKEQYYFKTFDGTDNGLKKWYLDWSPHDLLCEYNLLIQNMRRLTNSMNPEPILLELAKIGYNHYNKIFKLNVVRDKIETLIDNDNKIRVSVDSDTFIFPWSFLYTKDPSKNFDPSFFLGYNCTFFRLFNLEDDNDANLINTIKVANGQTEIAYGWCSSLQHAEPIEIDYIKRLHRKRALAGALEIPSLMQNDGIYKNVEKLKDILNDNKPLFIHLACHAENGDTSTERFIRLRNNTFFTERDLENSEFSFTDNPIIFLNACSVSFVHPNRYATFISFLLRLGARAVIAPECKIDDEKAAKFARSFLKFVFAERTDLSEAMFRARRERWNDGGDLTGLVYALYGQADAKIERL